MESTTIFITALEYEKKAFDATEGDIKEVMEKFVDIEQRHTDVVRFELDYASHNGFWLGFPGISMEEAGKE